MHNKTKANTELPQTMLSTLNNRSFDQTFALGSVVVKTQNN